MRGLTTKEMSGARFIAPSERIATGKHGHTPRTARTVEKTMSYTTDTEYTEFNYLLAELSALCASAVKDPKRLTKKLTK